MDGKTAVSSSTELLDVAVEAARTGGELLLARFQAGREPAVAAKTTPTDLVSEADLESERTIRALLRARRPDDGLLGEEQGDQPGSSGLRWVIDPLDGTVNFLYGIPQWCVSIAVEDSDGAVAGAVYDPCREELYCALRDGAATLNGRELEPSRCDRLDRALVATGLAYDARVRAAQGAVLARMSGVVRDLRRFGSAALDLCWTAAGRFDAYFERTVKPWDIAAGRLLCQSAGLICADLPVHPDLPWGIAVADAALIDELLRVAGQAV